MTDQEQDAGTTVRVTVGRRGGGDVLRAAREAAPSNVTVREVGPTGLTWQEPILAATRDGRTAAYGRVTPSGAKGLIDALADGLLEPPAFAVAETDEESFPAPDDGPLGVGERRVLDACGWVDPRDGTPVGTTPPTELEALARESNFRGRGRGDAVDGPVVESWDAARSADADPVVVVNGSDADPDADADRLLLESDPAAVVDGAVAAANVVGAAEVLVVLGERDRLARNRVEAVIAAARDDGVFGDPDARDDRQSIDGERRNSAGEAEYDVLPDVTVAVRADSFEADYPSLGLDTMLEGADSDGEWTVSVRTGQGFDGRPAVVHTPRTLAGLRSLAEHGESRIGATDDPGTRLVTVCGDSDRATVELPTDAPLSVALEAVGDPDFQFACVGGRLGGLTRTLDVAANADALAAAGLGTNGVVELFDESRCPVAVTGKRVRFAREHGCESCDACRETVPRLHEALRAVYAGEFDPAGLRDLCATLADAECPVAAAAARPVRTALEEFEPEFRSHADGDCPTGECN